MRVLFITNDFPPMSGGEATCYERLCETVPADQIGVLAPRIPGHETFDARQPYRVFRRRVPMGTHPIVRLIQMALLLAHAVTLVARERIVEVHIGHLYLGSLGLVLRYCRGTPYVLYLHGGEMAPYLRFSSIRALFRKVVRNARAVVVNSAYTLSQYEAMGMRNDCMEILVRAVGIERFRPDLDAALLRGKHGLNGCKVILTVGRLVERKGHDMVIRALPAVRGAVGSVRYLIVGSGPEEPRLRALACDVGCQDDVVFAGHVSDEDLPTFYACCDVFVMPSRALPGRDGIEGFGAVFLEAAACGKPVIAGRSGGIADAVVEGATGILVQPTDVKQLASVLTNLLLNPDEATRLGRNGRQRAEAVEAAWTATVMHIWDGALAGRDPR